MEEQPEFIERLRNGDEQAFRKLVEHYQEKVFNTVVSFVLSTEDAEDVSQEVFVEVYHSIWKFRGEASLGTWIYRIAVTKSLEHLRWKKRQKRNAFIRSFIQGPDQQPLEIPDEMHPGIQLEDRERAKVLFQAIELLPEKQRIAYTMHKMEDLSYQQIAEVMKTSLSSVESLMHRAKMNLQKRLYSYYKKNL